MLVSILKILMQITTKVFFKDISVRNRELIPKKGPIMILANHPSAFMDPIVISVLLNRKIYYLAKGELFKSKFAKWILPKLNMIPVYRKQDDPSLMSKNEETFNKCYEYLEKGCAILMFPEGISITERKLRPIKTGAARIVLGAEEKNGFNLGIQLFTVGLNYNNPHKFNRDLYVNISKPISALDYKKEYQLDNFNGATLLTEKIRIELEKLILSINEKETDNLIRDIESLYLNKASKDLGILEEEKDKEFIVSKNIKETVEHYLATDPQRAKNAQYRIQKYNRTLNLLGLNDTAIDSRNKNSSIFLNGLTSMFLIILGFPIYVYGILNNYLAFEIPGWISNKVTKSIEFRGPIAMVLGTFTFLIFYSIQLILFFHFSKHIIFTLFYALSLPISGLFAYWYYHFINRIKTNWLLMFTFFKRSSIVSELIIERASLISEFDKARDEYFKWKDSKEKL